MHGAAPPGSEVGGGGSEGTAETHIHANEVASVATAAQPPDATPAQPRHDPSHSQPCLCIGACAGSATAATTIAPPVVEIFEALPAAPLPAPERERAPAARGAYVLPFANGPPSAT